MSEDEHRDAGRWAAPGDQRPHAGTHDGGRYGGDAVPAAASVPGAPPAPSGWGAAPTGWGPAPGGWNGQGWNGQGWVAPPKPGVIPLRPLSVGEVLDGSLQAARRNAKAMIGSSLLFHVLMGVLTVLFLVAVGSSFLQLASTPSTELTRADVAAFTSALPALFLGELVFVAVALLGNTILQGALVIPVSRAVLDQRTSFRQMWSMVRPRIGALIGLALLLALIGVGAAIAMMIVLMVVGVGIAAATDDPTGAVVTFLVIGLGVLVVGAWFAVRLSVSGAVLVLEKCGPGQALARSWRLTRGSFWRLFGILALTMILVQIVTSIAGAPLQFATPLLSGVLTPTGAGLDQSATGLLITLLIAYLVLSTLVGAVTTVFLVGVTALLYVDLRMRREGLDVALMAEHDRLARGSEAGALPGTA